MLDTAFKLNEFKHDKNKKIAFKNKSKSLRPKTQLRGMVFRK